MKRRDFLTAAPAVALTTAVPVAATAQTTDPHPGWLIEWRAAREAWGESLADAGDETEASAAIWEQRMKLERAIYSTSAKTREGLIAQLTYVIEDGDCRFIDEGHGPALMNVLQSLTEARALVV